MRDATPRDWLRWRVTPALTPLPIAPRSGRLTLPIPISAATGEQPGPDGIRHELVARIRREIAAGTYDTEERWLAAEEALLRRVEART